MSEDFDLILVIVFVFIFLMIVFYYIETNLDKTDSSKPKVTTITTATVETLSNPNDSFCEYYESNPNELRREASKLTQKNCTNTKCTIWLKEKGSSDGRCVIGSETGPIFQTDNGVKLDIDNYYYMNKCYGQNCP